MTNGAGSTEQPAQSKSQLGQWLVAAWSFSKRFLTIFGALLAVYVAVGSILYGEWWYGFIWEANFLKWPYVRYGLLFLFDNHYVATLISIVGLFVLAAATKRYMSRFVLQFVDRLWASILAASLVALAVTAIVDRHYFKDSYDEDSFLGDSKEQPADQPRRMGQPVLVAPIEFKFLDEQQITALYSQITPEYVGKERSVEESGTTSAKAGLSTGPLNAELNKQSGSQIKSTEQRVEFTLQRKAIDTINFCLQNACDFYSTSDDWLLYRELEGMPLRAQRMLELVRDNGVSVSSAEFKALADSTSAEYREAKNKREKDSLRALEGQLSHTMGFVVIDGEYTIRDTGKEILLTHVFMNKPRAVRFAVSVPTLTHLDHLGQNSFFRVFGKVDQPLQKSGVVRVHALAVY